MDIAGDLGENGSVPRRLILPLSPVLACGPGATESGTTTATGSTGLDHLLIHRADFLNDRCTSIHFAWPTGQDPAFAITAPDGWNFAHASVAMNTDGCLAGMPTGDPVSAIGGAGAGTWQMAMDQYCPLTLDLDLTLDFPQDLPWVPVQERMLVTAVPVQSCP